MKEDAFAGRLATLAGLGTWAVIGVPALLELAGDPSRLLEPYWWVWLSAYLGFGALFAMITLDKFENASPQPQRVLLFLQTVLAAAAVLALPDYGFLAILFIITASHAAHVLPLKGSFAWVVAQTLFIGVVTLLNYPNPAIAGIQTLAYFGFQLFALLTTHGALKEAAGHQKLARLNAELRATQELLAESSRMGERIRISRELHDLLGHHLTVLSLNLEVATHVTEGKAKAHVQKAQSISKLLLADVREVVSNMRTANVVDVGGALNALVQDVPNLEIHLAVPSDLGIDDVSRAQVIVRCVQEIITNTVRHANAQNLWIELEQTAGGIKVHARDDGKGSSEVRVGNGLLGMRERLEGFGGRLEVSSSTGRGFTLDAWVPGGA
jgi:signal transduction histidine kinase